MDAPRGNPPVDRTQSPNWASNSSSANQATPPGQPSGHWADNLPAGWTRGDAGVTLLEADGEVSNSIMALGRAGPRGRVFDGRLPEAAGWQARLLQDRNQILRELNEAGDGMKDRQAAAKQVLANDPQFVKATKNDVNADPAVVKAVRKLQTVRARLDLAMKTAKTLGQHAVDLTPLQKELSNAQAAVSKARMEARLKASPDLSEDLDPADYPASEKDLRRLQGEFEQAQQARRAAERDANKSNDAIVAGEKELTKRLNAVDAHAAAERRVSVKNFVLFGTFVVAMGCMLVARPWDAYLQDRTARVIADIAGIQDILQTGVRETRGGVTHVLTTATKSHRLDALQTNLERLEFSLNLLHARGWVTEVAVNAIFALFVYLFTLSDRIGV